MVQEGCSEDSCSNSIQERISSPSGEVEAVIFLRDCGATTKSSYQLSIVKSGEKVTSTGNVFISYDDFDVRWNSDGELQISSTSDEVFKQKESIKGIKIKYSSW